MTAAVDIPWVRMLVDQVTDAIFSTTSLAWRARMSEDPAVMEIQIFPAILVVEGDELYSSDLTLDISKLLGVFDTPPTVKAGDGWVSFEGSFGKNVVDLMVIWDPPPDAPTMAKINADGTEEAVAGRTDQIPSN